MNDRLCHYGGMWNILLKQNVPKKNFYQNHQAATREINLYARPRARGFNLFAVSSTLSLPIQGLSDFSQVSSSILSMMKVNFSLKNFVVSLSCKKKEMKMEFHVPMDMVSKTLLVNAGSFDASTLENFFGDGRYHL